jgi:type II pantothenate kinase
LKRLKGGNKTLNTKRERILIIGIDIGSTTTKAVSIEDGKLTRKIKTRALDAITAATGALGKIVLENGIRIDAIERIEITGAGASKIKNDIFGIPTGRVNEIEAIGIGGMFLSGMNNIIITNIGTGTVIIEAGDRGIFHFGGSGVGGGTILGLAKKLLPTGEFAGIMELANTGKLNQVDLLLGDITDTSISFLNGESTAANFGKMLDTASPQDVALAIINMVYQVIGVLSAFAAKARNTNRVIITGNGSNNRIGQKVLADISSMYGIEFIYPEYAEYTTAVGAGLSKN